MKRVSLAVLLALALALPIAAQSTQEPASPPASTTRPDTSREADPNAASQYPNGSTSTAQPDAQTQTDQNATPQNSDQNIPTFHVNVVGRTTQAVNWHHASGSTKVDLRGTELMRAAHGEAKVDSELGRTRVETEIRDLGSPQQFGHEYLTYVLWAITPEGRAENLGEIIHDEHGNTKTQTFTTDLQAFGLIVTAEPYFAVTRPSNLVVLENVIRKDTVGATEPINVHYELLERGGYIPPRSTYEPLVVDPKVPFDLYEARNAVRIAAANGAEQYASDAYQRAVDLLTQAEGYAARKHVQAKPIATVAREAAQQAEDARVLAVRRKEQERVEREREEQAERTRVAQQNAEEARQRAEADAAARAQAEQQAQQASQAQQAAEQQRLDAQRQAEEAQRQAEEAARLRAQAEQQQQAAQQQAQAAQLAAQQAQQEKEQLRARLLQQFNTILATRDTARGLIAQMSDVLFATNSYQLKSQAQLALAKFAGIVLAYPGLRLQIEGNTDSTGTAQYNQRLSEKRANAVRDFLLAQGVPADSVSAVGLGQTNPVASNDTSSGRRQNRRVDIVVSGEVIGQPLTAAPGQPTAAGQQPAPSAPPPQQQTPVPTSTGPTNPNPR